MPSREFHTPITGTPAIRTAMNTALGELDAAIGQIGVQRALILSQGSPPSLTATTWVRRSISGLINPNTIVTTFDIFNSDFRVAAGTYLLKAKASVYNVGLNRLRLYNLSAASVVQVGLCHNVGSLSDVVRMSCVFTATGSQDYRIEHWAASTDGDGQGESQSGGNNLLQVLLVRLSAS